MKTISSLMQIRITKIVPYYIDNGKYFAIQLAYVNYAIQANCKHTTTRQQLKKKIEWKQS